MATILLVEDNHLNREMFSRRLERKGFRVLSAADGREAIGKAQTEHPDLILMDLSLPVIDGWEASRRIKGDPATQAIPIIALTAHAMVGDREKAVQAGCNDYEPKPVDLQRLLTKIHALLGRPAGQPEPRPVAPPTPAPTAVPRDPAPSPSATVLVVDDNPLNRDMLSRRLEREGCRVVLAPNGREALNCLERQACDLVLLDMMMPEMNGIDVLGCIRSSYSLVELPVIIVTAKEQSEDMVAALQLGANDYIIKPFHFPVLLARVQTHLQVKRSARAGAPPVTARAFAGSGTTPYRKTAAPARTSRFAAEAALSATHLSSTVVLDQTPVSGDRSSNSGSWHSGDRPFRPSDKVSDSHPGTWNRPFTDGDSRTFRPGDRVSDSHPGNWNRPGSESDTLAGYEIIEEIGRGGMGVVFKARHVRMNRLVALKVINKEHLINPRTIQRFYREIQAAAQLSHPNIVMAFDAGQFSDAHYFAMEYVDGVDLNRLVQKHGPLPVKYACNFVAQAARGLQHAFERGLVHRDVKPSNLFVTCCNPSNTLALNNASLPPLERATVKILDLGLALLYEAPEASEAASGLTRDGRVVGTADYMAPEQWMNAHKVDIRADLYALGGTFYYLLTGQVPFPSDEPMEKMLKHHLDEPIPIERLRPGVPPAVLSAVRRLLAKKPDDRYQQPIEFVDDLQSIQTS